MGQMNRPKETMVMARYAARHPSQAVDPIPVVTGAYRSNREAVGVVNAFGRPQRISISLAKKLRASGIDSVWLLVTPDIEVWFTISEIIEGGYA